MTKPALRFRNLFVILGLYASVSHAGPFADCWEYLLRAAGKRAVRLDALDHEISQFSTDGLEQQMRILQGVLQTFINDPHFNITQLRTWLDAEEQLLTLLAAQLSHSGHSLRITNSIEILPDCSSAFGNWLAMARQIVPELRLRAAPYWLPRRAGGSYTPRSKVINLSLDDFRTPNTQSENLGHEFIHGWIHELVARRKIAFPYAALSPMYDTRLPFGGYEAGFASDEIITWTFNVIAEVRKGFTSWRSGDGIFLSSAIAKLVAKSSQTLAQMCLLLKEATEDSVGWTAKNRTVYFHSASTGRPVRITPNEEHRSFSGPNSPSREFALRLNEHVHHLRNLHATLRHPPTDSSPEDAHARFWRDAHAAAEGVLQNVLDLYLLPGTQRLDAEALLNGEPKLLAPL